MLPHLASSLRLRAIAVGCLSLAVAGALLTDTPAPERARLAAAAPSAQRFTQLTTDAQFRTGTGEGVRVARGAVTMATPRGRVRVAGRTYAWSRYTSALITPGQPFTELIPTWNITTPGKTAVLVQARVRTTAGSFSGWKVMGTWATRDTRLRRSSGGTQTDSVARVATDTLVARSGALASYQLRVLLLRGPAGTASPVVRSSRQ